MKEQVARMPRGPGAAVVAGKTREEILDMQVERLLGKEWVGLVTDISSFEAAMKAKQRRRLN